MKDLGITPRPSADLAQEGEARREHPAPPWRRIGLIGGIGWPSTRDYYERLNRAAAECRGGLASADLVVRSLDFARVLDAAETPGGVEAMLSQAARELLAAGAEVIGLCSNTGHLFSQPLRTAEFPGFIALDGALAQRLADNGVGEAWLLGVQRTLEHPLLRDALAARGIRSFIPEAPLRRQLDEAIFAELERGEVGLLTRDALASIEAELQSRGARDVVLACTELPMALADRPWPFRCWDTVEIHCQALIAAASRVAEEPACGTPT
ncbi:MAG: amino acid racemase [Pigmentiphaga sp.]|nr:amino acid racemase [Pigmentiphaga sp.]